MIVSPNHSARGNSKVRLVVIHTAEGARTTAALGNYFAKASVQASSHVGIDEASIEQYVDYSRASWTVRAGNPVSDNAELCGFAAWTRDQWLNEHRGMLNLTAQWVRQRCLARGIPIVKLTPAQVAAGQAGVIGHHDWTLGMRDGSHTDPGNGFPWDVVINTAANGATPPVTVPKGLFMALTDAQQLEILEAARSVLFGKANVRPAGEMAMAVYNLQRSLDSMALRVDELVKKPAGQVDTAPVVAAVVDAVTRAGIADKVLDGLAAALSSRPV